jgi:hypothetical protein
MKNMAVIKQTLGEKRRSVPPPTKLETLNKQLNHTQRNMSICRRIIEIQTQALNDYEIDTVKIRMEIMEETEKERREENART